MALKSKALANNWSRTSQLCEATVRSALGQTDPDVRVVVACHEPPDWRLPPDPRLDVISVDFPPPPRDYVAMNQDKWDKRATALIRAGQLNPQFVMVMDADDLVSNRIAALTKAHPNSNGWIIKKGYKYWFGSRWALTSNTYNCGTNAVVSSRLVEFPSDLSEASRTRCSVLRWGHLVIEQEMRAAGTPLEVMPFRGGVYITHHGDNQSGMRWPTVPLSLKSRVKYLTRHRYLTPRLRREFAFDPLLASQ